MFFIAFDCFLLFFDAVDGLRCVGDGPDVVGNGWEVIGLLLLQLHPSVRPSVQLLQLLLLS